MSNFSVSAPNAATPPAKQREREREGFTSLQVAAEHFAVSETTLRRHIATKRIPAYRFGRGIRVKLSEIEESLTRMGSAA
ncbi:helix-turn-helix domain-containing protein [Corynebacterium sp. A21]|uniref:helix-turn-helix domain-containing protein n=1 Tax=Corynebacterium sp. A21 TaxID=3457318 RepID=UPI003FD0D910